MIIQPNSMREIVEYFIANANNTNINIQNFINNKCNSTLAKQISENKLETQQDSVLSLSFAKLSDTDPTPIAAAIGACHPLSGKCEPVDSETIYNVGSISKFILMVLALRIIQSGKLKLTSTVYECLQDDSIPNAKSITIQHLLDHRSGLRDCDYIPITEHDPLTKILRYKDSVPDLAGDPGKNFYYANINFILLAHILTTATKKNLQACFNEYIGDLLGLNHTFVVGHETASTKRAYGYKVDVSLNMLKDISDFIIFGASSFRSIPSDLVKIMSNFFTDSNFIDEKYRNLIINSIRSETFEVVTKTETYRWPIATGIGIDRFEAKTNNGETIVLFGHGGWQDGHTAFLAFTPHDNTAYCCCATKTQGMNLLKTPRQMNSLFKLTNITPSNNDARRQRTFQKSKL